MTTAPSPSTSASCAGRWTARRLFLTRRSYWRKGRQLPASRGPGGRWAPVGRRPFLRSWATRSPAATAAGRAWRSAVKASASGWPPSSPICSPPAPSRSSSSAATAPRSRRSTSPRPSTCCPPGRLVLGPAADGGYYLIGAGRETWTTAAGALTRMLATSPMSSPSLLAHTLRSARAAGLQVVQLPLWVDVDEPADLGVLDRLEGRSPRGASRSRSARGLPPRDASLRPRLQALLRRRRRFGGRRVDHRRVARCDRPVRRARRGHLRVHRRRPAHPRRLHRPARPHHGRPRRQGAVLLQQPGRRTIGGRIEPRRPRAAHATGEHRRTARDQRRAARPGQLRRRPGVDSPPAGGGPRAGGQHGARAARRCRA